MPRIKRLYIGIRAGIKVYNLGKRTRIAQHLRPSCDLKAPFAQASPSTTQSGETGIEEMLKISANRISAAHSYKLGVCNFGLNSRGQAFFAGFAQMR